MHPLFICSFFLNKLITKFHLDIIHIAANGAFIILPTNQQHILRIGHQIIFQPLQHSLLALRNRNDIVLTFI